MNQLFTLLQISLISNWDKYKHLVSQVITIKLIIQTIMLEKRETIALIAKNSNYWGYVYLAALFSGKKLLIINPNLSLFHIEYLLKAHNCNCVFVDIYFESVRIMAVRCHIQNLFIIKENTIDDVFCKNQELVGSLITGYNKIMESKEEAVQYLTSEQVFDEDVAFVTFEDKGMCCEEKEHCVRELHNLSVGLLQMNLAFSSKESVITVMELPFDRYHNICILYPIIADAYAYSGMNVLFANNISRYKFAKPKKVILEKDTFERRLKELFNSRYFKSFLFAALWNIPFLRFIALNGLKRAKNRMYGGEVNEYIIIGGYDSPLALNLSKRGLKLSSLYLDNAPKSFELPFYIKNKTLNTASNLESIIKASKFIEDCALVQSDSNDELILLVVLDQQAVTLINNGEKTFSLFMKTLLSSINKELNGLLKIDKIVVYPNNIPASLVKINFMNT